MENVCEIYPQGTGGAADAIPYGNHSEQTELCKPQHVLHEDNSHW